MQWLRFSEDGTGQRGALTGSVAAWALELEGMVCELAVVLQLVCEESDYCEGQQEGQAALVSELLQVVVVLSLARDPPWPHHPGHLAIFATCCPCCLLAGPAVQCSKAGRVTNAKARIQI